MTDKFAQAASQAEPQLEPPANEKHQAVPPTNCRTRSVWIFLVIALGLAICATMLAIIWYRSRYPLTAARLQQAIQLWRQHGAANYNLQITITGRMPGTYFVEVRQNQVRRAVLQHPDGRETDILTVTQPDGRTIHRDGREWSMPGLFEWLERDLERDGSSTKAYTFVLFDAKDGHLIEYLRSESAQHYRLRVQLIPVMEQ